jgi:hypothetical protein
MAIETTLQPRQTWMNLLYAFLCAALALWGAYDYWVSIPAREAAVALYERASHTFSELQDKASAHERSPATAPALTAEETAALVQAQADLATFRNEKPNPPASYDRFVQVWFYMVGCGVLGTPWFLWAWFAARRKHYSMDDDGALHAPEGVFQPEEIADIDMSRWMSKSIATVRTTDGRSIVLDDYKYRNMHLIVGALAVRFHPEAWTEDARDRRKIEAETAAAAEAPMEETDPHDPHVIRTDTRADREER